VQSPFDPKTDRAEIDWNIPLNYNNWKIDKKKKLIAECLSENCSSDGTKISELRSEVIENYLKYSKENKEFK
jgi:hypothetical protein